MSARWFAAVGDRGGAGDDLTPAEGDRAVSQPDGSTYEAGEGLTDEEMVQAVAGSTDSASENADVAGKDWDGDPAATPAPDDRT